jgi:hypothetical protein
MGFIPKSARWYLADVVLEHRIEGEPRNVVDINTHLVEAGSPEEAYTKALTIGRDAENDYTNTEDARVQVVFRGIKQLSVIHEKLEDGAELMYSRKVGVSEDELNGWNKPMDRLAVFAPIQPGVEGPNSVPGLVNQLVDHLLPGEPGTDEPGG